jgi:hypothetical protein
MTVPNFRLYRPKLVGSAMILLAFAVYAAAIILSSHPALGQSLPDNSIVVGQAKLYDERSLEALLGAVENGISGQNGSGVNYVSPSTVAQHEGLTQGGETSSSNLSLNLDKLPDSAFAPIIPKPVATGLTPGTTAPPPAYAYVTPGVGGASGYTPTWENGTTSVNSATAPISVSSADTLQQQVGLSFQATNLALLLQHSVSDRLIMINGKLVPRSLAVLGFQVTVEPSSKDKYRAAVVDITVKNPSNLTDAPQVVMMLPQDKTYNVAQVTSDSRSLGLGVASMPLVGSLGASSSHGSAYIVYDVDTVALQRQQSSNADSVTFSWEFRPVLGQPAVQPGTRQVFVLLALPVPSEQVAGESSAQVPPYVPQITVSSSWVKMDTKSKTLNTGDVVPVCSSANLDPLPIYGLNTYEDSLAPIVENVDWHDAGNGSMYIEAEGENFSPSTSIVYSGQDWTAPQESGGRLISFDAPLESIRYEDPVVIGAYGLPIPLAQPELKDNSGNIEPSDAGEGIKIHSITVTPVDESNSKVRIQLIAKNGDPSIPTPLAPRLPINAQITVSIGDDVYGLNDTPIGEEWSSLTSDASSADSTADSTILYPTFDVVVPDTVLETAQKVTLRYLFAGGRYGDDYRSDYALPVSAFRVDQVSVVSKGANVVLAITGLLPPDLTGLINNVTYSPATDVSGAYLELKPPVGAIAGENDSKPGSHAVGVSHAKWHKNTANSRGEIFPYEVGQAVSTLATGAVLQRGATPVTDEPGTSPPSFNIALLYTTQKELLKGAENLVLYKPGAPAQLISLTDVIKDIDVPPGKFPATTPTAQQTIPNISFSIGPPTSSATAASTSTAPPGPASPVAGIATLKTITRSGSTPPR